MLCSRKKVAVSTWPQQVNGSAVQQVGLEQWMVHTPTCTIHMNRHAPNLGLPDPPSTDSHNCPPFWWSDVAVAHTLHQQHQQCWRSTVMHSNPAGHPCPAPQPCRTLSACVRFGKLCTKPVTPWHQALQSTSWAGRALSPALVMQGAH